jgi:hypothetical protein
VHGRANHFGGGPAFHARIALSPVASGAHHRVRRKSEFASLLCMFTISLIESILLHGGFDARQQL